MDARIHGSDFKFAADELFGNVLSLQGNSEVYISIPGESVTGEESLSITGWSYLRSATPGQLFSDFGKNGSSHFFTSPNRTSGHKV